MHGWEHPRSRIIAAVFILFLVTSCSNFAPATSDGTSARPGTSASPRPAPAQIQTTLPSTDSAAAPTSAYDLASAIEAAQVDFDTRSDAYNAVLRLYSFVDTEVRPKILYERWVKLEAMRIKAMVAAQNTDISIATINIRIHDYAASIRSEAIEAGLIN